MPSPLIVAEQKRSPTFRKVGPRYRTTSRMGTLLEVAGVNLARGKKGEEF